MKHLLTLALFAFGLNAIAQFPNLPYNPDENGDGLIGVVDLQGLLANYGSEFSSAVLSEDGESAISYIGTMNFPLCAVACRNLPGHWELPDLEDLGLVWSNVSSGSEVWLNAKRYGPSSPQIYVWRPNNSQIATAGNINEVHKCYCAAKQLPRVEYEFCAPFVGNVEGFRTCCQDLVSDGWYPLNVDPGSGTTRSNSTVLGQAFWRWAE